MATVGPLGDLRGLPFAGSAARDINPAGGTLFGTNTAAQRVWVEFSVGAGAVMGTGDPYSQSPNFDGQPNNRNAYINFIENCKKQQVGGEYFTLDTTALLVSGVQTNLAWIIPVLSAAGIGAVVLRKKF